MFKEQEEQAERLYQQRRKDRMYLIVGAVITTLLFVGTFYDIRVSIFFLEFCVGIAIIAVPIELLQIHRYKKLHYKDKK